MSLFPSVWDLILPNWNIFTVIGAIVIGLGVGGFVFLKVLDKVLPLNVGGTSLMLILIGIFLVWGISMIQDVLGTVGGWIILGVLVIIGLIVALIKVKGKGETFSF